MRFNDSFKNNYFNHSKVGIISTTAILGYCNSYNNNIIIISTRINKLGHAGTGSNPLVRPS